MVSTKVFVTATSPFDAVYNILTCITHRAWNPRREILLSGEKQELPGVSWVYEKDGEKHEITLWVRTPKVISTDTKLPCRFAVEMLDDPYRDQDRLSFTDKLTLTVDELSGEFEHTSFGYMTGRIDFEGSLTDILLAFYWEDKIKAPTPLLPQPAPPSSDGEWTEIGL